MEWGWYPFARLFYQQVLSERSDAFVVAQSALTGRATLFLVDRSQAVDAESIRTDQPLPETDLLIRRGPDHRVRGALFDEDQRFVGASGTTVTVYPRESRRPPLVRRLLERYVL